MGSLKTEPMFSSFLSFHSQAWCLALSRCLVNSDWMEMKKKADISSVCPAPQGSPGLQVEKESGVCSLSRNRSDDRLTSKTRGGEGRGCGFSNAFLAVWELQLAAEVGQGVVGSLVRPQPGLQRWNK